MNISYANFLMNGRIAAASDGKGALAIVQFNDGSRAVFSYAPRSLGLGNNSERFDALRVRAAAKLDLKTRNLNR